MRIYRNDTSILAERAIYNFNTKSHPRAGFRRPALPYAFSGESACSRPVAGAQFNVRNSGIFTTDDSSKPDYHLTRAASASIPDNRVIFVGSTLYVGTTPVFYFPYFYQSLDQQSGYQVTPGYSSIYGAYLLTGVSFPVTDKLTGTRAARLPHLARRRVRGAQPGIQTQPPHVANRVPPAAGATPYASDDDPSRARPARNGAPNESSPTTPMAQNVSHQWQYRPPFSTTVRQRRRVRFFLHRRRAFPVRSAATRISSS